MTGFEDFSLMQEIQREAQVAQDITTGQSKIATLSAEFNAEIENAKAVAAASGGNIQELPEAQVKVAQNYAQPDGSAYLTDAAYRGGPAGFDNRNLILAAGSAAPNLTPGGQGLPSGQPAPVPQTPKGPAKIIPFPNQGTPPAAQNIPKNVPGGLQRLGPLIGFGVAGWAIGDQAGQWYIGKEGLAAKGISDYVGRQSLSWGQMNEIGSYLGFPKHQGTQGHVDYANGLLSLKAGKQVDFRTMEPNALADLIEAPWPDAATIRQNADRLRAQAQGGEKTDPAIKPETEAKPDALPVPEPDKQNRFCRVEGTPPSNDVEKKFVEDVRNEALKRMDTLSNKERGPVLTGVMDPQTPGKIFYGMNSPQQVPPANLHPLLQKRLDTLNESINDGTFKPGERCGVPGSHSEIYALDEALKAREARLGRPMTEADLSEMLLHNRSLARKHSGDLVPIRCDNCTSLTDGVKVIRGE